MLVWLWPWKRNLTTMLDYEMDRLVNVLVLCNLMRWHRSRKWKVRDCVIDIKRYLMYKDVTTLLLVVHQDKRISEIWAFHHHHVPEGLGVFPVHWSSKWSWSLHLFLGRPVFLRPFVLYCSACFGSLCPSSVHVVATSSGTVLFHLLCSVLPFFAQYIHYFFM